MINGQALCPECNEQKGDKALASPWRSWPTEEPERAWQDEAVEAFERKGHPDFLCVSTPGAGKTRFALRMAHRLLTDGRVERVVIVVPTEHLKVQWQKAASRVGIELKAEVSNQHGLEGEDMHGCVLTYAQVARAPLVHRTQCRRPTLVILDEPHHAGSALSWGAGVREAFEHAAFRLSITGTPFRSDSNAIPFIQYALDKDGHPRSVADFTYGYGQAIADQVCRPVYFPTYEGTMTWWTSSDGEMTATFADELTDEEQRRRLRTAIAPSGEFLLRVLRDADARLTDVRRSHYALAAGLVIAGSDADAREIARMLQSISGEPVKVATSYDQDASDIITRFADGADRWLVAVKMVSEGVDIPRLFVGVYATPVLTELFFRQAVGRFVRWLSMPDLTDQPAYLYMPRDPYLLQYAQSIRDERDHVLEDHTGEDPDGDAPTDAASDTDSERLASSLFTPIGSEAVASDVLTHDGEHITQAEADLVRRYMAMANVRGTPEDIAKVLRIAMLESGRALLSPVPTPKTEPVVLPLEARKKRIRSQIQHYVAKFCAALGWEYPTAHNLINASCRFSTKRDLAPLPQLECAVSLAKYLYGRSLDDEARYIDDWLGIARRFVNTYEREHGQTAG